METKKTKRANVYRKSGLYFGVGLLISTSLTITAFEWMFYDNTSFIIEPEWIDPETVLIEIPITVQPQPKPPIIPEQIKEVEDDEPIEEPEVILSTEATEIDEIEIDDFRPPEPEIAEEPAYLIIVEENASFTGGMKAYAKFLKKNLKYPKQARRMSIEGRVYVQFIIEKDGSITEVTAIKGIGAGCDEEAVRVIAKSPKWNPGKQRGRAVRQRMVIPIVFKLS